MSISNTAPTAVSKPPSTPAVSKTNIILIVLLLLQLALCVYLFWPSNPVATPGQPLLPGVTAESVTGMTITDNNKKSITLVKQGDSWTMAGTDGYPVLSDKVSQALTKLLSIKTDRLVTQTAGSHDRLEVAESNFQRKIELTSTAASAVQTVYLGSSPGAAATHVRSGNEDATYLTGALAAWELDTMPSSWIDVTYYSVPKEQLTAVTLKNANGTFNLVPKSGTADWTLADATPEEPVAPANINTLLDRLTTLNLQSVLGKSDSPAYGLSAPLATLIITSTEAVSSTAATSDTAATAATVPGAVKVTTLVVGAKDEANNAYYLKSSDSDYYVSLAAFTGDDFVNKKRADFMTQTTSDSSSALPGTLPLETPVASEEAPEVAATAPAVEDAVTPEAVDLEAGSTPVATVGAIEALTETNTVTDATQAVTESTAVSATEVTTETAP